MTNNNLFDHVDTTPSEEDVQSYHDLLVGEGKKFRDDEALAKGKIESDRFIQQLQREQAQLRADLDSRLNMEELVQKLGNRTSTVSSTNDIMERQPDPTPVVTPTPVVDPDAIVNIVKNTMTQENTKLQQERNLNAVATQLKKVWGDDWVSKLRKVGASLDLTEAQMDIMAKTSPKVLLQAVMPSQNKVDTNMVTPPRSQILGIPQQAPESGWSKYEKLRKENPSAYYSPKVQLQLERDVRAGKVILPSE